jgi:hypothetical protein
MRKGFYIVVLCLLSYVAVAQPKAYVRRNTFLLGEQTELIYEVKGVKKTDKLSFIPQKKKITGAKGLEIIGVFQDTLIPSGKVFTWQGSYTITAWDSGRVIIPETNILVNDSVLKLSALRLFIKTPTIKEGKGLYDIKEGFEEVPSSTSLFFQKYWGWIVGGLLLILGIILYFKFRKKKEKIIPEITLSLKEATIKEIDALFEKRLWEHEGLKEHYFQLSLILRTYLGKRYTLSLMDKTSYQIEVLLGQLNLHHSLQTEINLMLNQADLVKFAKSSPDITEVTRSIQRAKDIVTKTSKFGE